MTAERFIETLVEQGLIPADALVQAGVGAVSGGIRRQARLEAYLLSHGLISETELLAALKSQYALETVPSDAFRHIERDALDMLPRETILEHRVIPARRKNGTLEVFVVEPLDAATRELIEDEVEALVKERVWPAVRYHESLVRLLGDEPSDWLKEYLESMDLQVSLHEDSLAHDEPNIERGLGWTLSEALEYIESALDRDVILETLLGFSSGILESSAILVLGKGTIQVAFARNWELVMRDGEESMRQTRASLVSGAAIFATSPQRDSPANLGLEPLFDAFGSQPESELLCIPVPIAKRTGIVLVGPANADAATDELEIAAEAVGKQIETIIKLVKSGGLPDEAERIPDYPARILALHEADVESESSAMSEVSEASESTDDNVDSDLAEEVAMALDSVVSEAIDLSDVAELDDSDSDVMPRTMIAPRMPFSGPPPLKGADETSERGRPKFGSESDIDIDDDSYDVPSHTDTIHGPRLAQVSEHSESIPSPPEVDANSTMFGAPFVTAPEKTPPMSEKMASSTMFGIPAFSEGGFKMPGSPTDSEPIERELSLPEVDEDQALDASVSEAALDDLEAALVSDVETSGEPRGSEVQIVRPKEIGDESSDRFKTQLGGLEAQADLMSGLHGNDRSPTHEERMLSGETLRGGMEVPGSTMRGGIEAPLLDESSAGEDSFGHDVAEIPGLIPGMMILRPAKGRKPGKKTTSTPAEPSKAAAKASDDGEKPRRHRKPTPNPHTTMPGYGTEKSDASSSAPPAISDEISTNTMMGMQDDWADGRPKTSETVNDAWLDYFGVDEEAEHRAKETVDVSSSDASEPHSLPPEALERLLESGPDALEIQEHFLDMDNRDRKIAFAAAEEVANAGPRAYEPLSSMFPGRAFVDRYQYTPETMPAVGSHGPVMAALSRIGDDGAASVAGAHLEAKSNEERFYAVFLFTELPATNYLEQLVDRLFDKDAQIRAIARSIVLRYRNAPRFESTVLRQLREEVELAQEDLRVEFAADILAQFRDVSSLAILIDALGRHPEHTNKAIRSSLQLITLQSWASPYEWKQWWETAQTQPRSMWLVAALDSQVDWVRELAGDEIKLVPGLEIVYDPAQPSKLRQRAQKLAEKWFEDHS